LFSKLKYESYIGLAEKKTFQSIPYINQRFEVDKEEKSARLLKGIPEKPCILKPRNPKMGG
jgi:hypothetical protein